MCSRRAEHVAIALTILGACRLIGAVLAQVLFNRSVIYPR